ncbi:putative Actin family [Helianthus annuus]|uniref:Actin family n=1 Tax=Helianthus annuus TaxID=4232 RepID=A0A9K3J940_HELAN|nr:putative Actin family [Helianthus annuus]KAJ0581762.1 hypothetical protein HanHA300_Chr04g0144791 [Helianthus annuus]KAJ0589812.1 hypothetical protein HanIR_Chr04g0190441 [Helianthus annuus]KAJ0597724.1 hypothetical protein HanHA89_Chr04g0157911 [Helianthus annuus]KAJ0758368.1 hypothetical protein HanLR1_Chr04g0149611 [Helianthus annuus]
MLVFKFLMLQQIHELGYEDFGQEAEEDPEQLFGSEGMESLAAVFGNGLSTTCVVNIGAQVTSVICVEVILTYTINQIILNCLNRTSYIINFARTELLFFIHKRRYVLAERCEFRIPTSAFLFLIVLFCACMCLCQRC